MLRIKILLRSSETRITPQRVWPTNIILRALFLSLRLLASSQYDFLSLLYGFANILKENVSVRKKRDANS